MSVALSISFYRRNACISLVKTKFDPGHFEPPEEIC